MKTTKIICILIILVASTSCQSLIFRLGGMRKPKIETAESVQKFMLHLNQSTEDIYAIDSALFEQLGTKPFKPGWPTDFRPAQFRIYNSNYLPIVHWASCEGFLSYLGTFDTVPPRNQVNLDSTLNLQDDLARYCSIEGKPVNIEIEEGYDYYIVVYIAHYLYGFNKLTFKAIDNYKKEHPELKIKVYKINIDVMDWWNVELETGISIH